MFDSETRFVVFGATGAVGRTLLAVLYENGARHVIAVASQASRGRQVNFGEHLLYLQTPEKIDYSQVDFCLMSVDNLLSQTWGPRIAKQGCVVIDNSAYWRMESDVPLIVPEINTKQLLGYAEKWKRGEGFIVASPNCIAIPLSIILGILRTKVGINHVSVATYQSTSGAGDQAMTELLSQTKAFFTNTSMVRHVFPKQIAFNVIPQIGAFLEDGATEEEIKIVQETQKILSSEIPISLTSVRVPTTIGHAMAIHIVCAKPLSIEDVRKLFEAHDGLLIVDRHVDGGYVTPEEAAGSHLIYLSRLRNDRYVKNGFNLWVVTDNLRKGAAYNALQIAHELYKFRKKLS